MKPKYILKKLSEENDRGKEIVTCYNVVFFETAIEAMEKYAKQEVKRALVIAKHGTENWVE